MEEAVVSFALNEIRDLVVAEGRLLSGVSDEVKELEEQLEEMKYFLEDADRRRHENKTIFKWLVEIRDLTYRAEAAIEVHAARVLSSRRRRGLRQAVRRYSCIMKECHSLHQLGSDISQIKSDLEKVTKKLQDNGVTRSIIVDRDQDQGESSDNRARKTFPDFEIGDCFVGMEDELKQLNSLITEDKEHRVISVWGMGGSGKTTIAKMVYNHMIKQSENRCFDCFAWVCISQQCQIQSVLEDILSQLKNGSTSTLNETQLMKQLCEIQRDKRCLIVVDDLWKLTHWDGLKHAFLVQDLQSKILVTTREQQVAEIGFPLKLGLLNEDDALDLLKKKAFPRTNIPAFAFDENLDKIGKVMVRKCGYLPLAISLLGGVLSKKKSMVEWESVNDNIRRYIYRDEKEIDGVLNLSYENLPFYLKPCFLYMGIFEEDKRINVNHLYRMWIAQGMVSYDNIQDKEKTITEIAEDYLIELASRSIVQIEIDEDDRKICKLHDVIRELCLKIGKKDEFGVQILEYQGGECSTVLQEPSSHVKIRHLAIHTKREFELENTITFGEDTSKHLRTLEIFNNKSWVAIEFPTQSIADFQKFKLLRDLTIVWCKFAGRKLPRGITKLVHLRCLRLEFCEFNKLPTSIRNLVYLDTLSLSCSRNVRVPYVFKEMFGLKHLILPCYDEEKIGNDRLILDEGVHELETLDGLDSRVHKLKCTGKMKNMRHFRAFIHDNESLLGIMNAVTTEWNKLVSCKLDINQGCELGTSEEGLKLGKLQTLWLCPSLHFLSINVKLGKLQLAKCASDIMSSKLMAMSLSECEIEDDPLGILGMLPCLRQLYLHSTSFVGEEMTCPSFSFPSLKKLVLNGLPNLREWRVEAGAMPILSLLCIRDCSSLEMLPDGLSGISTLQQLAIDGMPELGKRVSSSPAGEDFHKVSHVPSITVI